MEQQGKKKLAWVQNDLFCNCGYNLFAQPVQLDERLGIPVSRCPECGKFHAMTTTFASLSTWRSRQEQVIILTVTLSVLIFLGLAILGLWGMQMGYLELDREYTFYVQRHTFYYQGGPNGAMVYNTPNPSGQVQLYWFMQIYRFLCALAGFIFVNIVMTFFWHWKKRLYYVLLAIPAIAAGFSVWFIMLDKQNMPAEYRLQYDETAIVFGALFEVIGMIIAIWLGRRTIRGLIRVFVPHKWRTPFKHLWLVDGLELPNPLYINSTQEILPAEPQAPVVQGPPESKVPENRKGLDSATDVIARMMKSEQKPPTQPENPTP